MYDLSCLMGLVTVGIALYHQLELRRRHMDTPAGYEHTAGLLAFVFVLKIPYLHDKPHAYRMIIANTIGWSTIFGLAVHNRIKFREEQERG